MLLESSLRGHKFKNFPGGAYPQSPIVWIHRHVLESPPPDESPVSIPAMCIFCVKLATCTYTCMLHDVVLLIQSSAITRKLDKIHTLLLKNADDLLYVKLKELAIPAQTYGMWVLRTYTNAVYILMHTTCVLLMSGKSSTTTYMHNQYLVWPVRPSPTLLFLMLGTRVDSSWPDHPCNP